MGTQSSSALRGRRGTHRPGRKSPRRKRRKKQSLGSHEPKPRRTVVCAGPRRWSELLDVGDLGSRQPPRAEKIGWARYLEEINSRPSLVTESGPLALREPPGKD